MTLLWRTNPELNEAIGPDDFQPLADTGVALELNDKGRLELGGWYRDTSITIHELTYEEAEDLHEWLRRYLEDELS